MSTQEEMQQWLKEIENSQSILPDEIALESSLPCGAQGVVFRGQVLGQPAAIKIYFPGHVEQRVQREVDALKVLQCRNIVSLLWAGELSADGWDLRVVATELVDGGSLDAVISIRALTHQELGILAFDCSEAIEAMWSGRIVHRDLKPSNIVLTPERRAKVIDLGVARHLDHSSLTAMGMTWGTLGYMSPEQTRTIRQLTCKSDVFSLGVILVESALGRHPSQRDQHRLLSRALHKGLPNEIEDWEYAGLVMAMLHPRPTSRPRPSNIKAVLAEYAP